MATYERRKGCWRVKVRRAGFPAQTRSFNTKTLAQAQARDIENKMDRGDFVDRTEAEGNTLGDVLKRYVREVSPTKKGQAAEELHIRSILKYSMRHLRMSVLKSSHIAGFRDERAAVVSSSTVNRELTIVSHAIQTARREWEIYMPENPVHMVRRLRAPLARSRRLPQEEEDQLLAACGQSRGKFLVPVVKLALETAMRRGEIVRIERKRIDLRNSVLLLPDIKNGSPRPVSLSNVAKVIIGKVLVDMSVTGHKSMSSMLRYSHVRGLAVTEKLNNLIGHQSINPQQSEAQS